MIGDQVADLRAGRAAGICKSCNAALNCSAAREGICRGSLDRQGRARSANHVYLGNGLVDRAHAFPVLREEGGGAWRNLKHFAALMYIGAASRQKVAKLIARNVAEPFTRRASPDATFRATLRALVEQSPGSGGDAFDHRWNRPPVHQIGYRQRTLNVGCQHSVISRLKPKEIVQAAAPVKKLSACVFEADR